MMEGALMPGGSIVSAYQWIESPDDGWVRKCVFEAKVNAADVDREQRRLEAKGWYVEVEPW